MADPTLAEAVLDPLLHRAHRVAVKAPSMRDREPEDEATPAKALSGRTRTR